MNAILCALTALVNSARLAQHVGKRANGSLRKGLTGKRNKRCRRPWDANDAYRHLVMEAGSVKSTLSSKSWQAHFGYLLFGALFRNAAHCQKALTEPDRLIL